MIQSLQTANFSIEYDPAVYPNAPKRATALQGVVESEFAVLTSWFAVGAGFLQGNKITVRLTTPAAKGAAGDNAGYEPAGKTLIEIDPKDSATDDAAAAESVKSVFVAEFVEVLMSYNNKTTQATTWDPGHSDGEGLSLFCADMRYPKGIVGVRINAWMQAVPPIANPDWPLPPPRPDWISQTEPSDTHIPSYGGSLLFLYYLKSQLGKSEPQIIQHGGATLEATYANLVGQPGGYVEFRKLLDRFFPVGKTPAFLTNDPFPLWDVGQRQVYVHMDQVTGSQPVASGSVEAGFVGCKGLSTFKFDVFRAVTTFHATTVGFGLPVYTWRVNGVDVDKNGATINPIVNVYDNDPSSPTYGSSGTQAVKLDCKISGDTLTSDLTVDPPANIGQFDAIVEVLVSEQFASTDVSSSAASFNVVTNRVVFEPGYYKAQKECWARFVNRTRKLARPFDHLDHAISVILTLPDPPQLHYGRVVQHLEQIAGTLHKIAEVSPTKSNDVGEAVEVILGLEPGALKRFSRGE